MGSLYLKAWAVAGRFPLSSTSSNIISHHSMAYSFPTTHWLILGVELLKHTSSPGPLHWLFHLPGTYSSGNLVSLSLSFSLSLSLPLSLSLSLSLSFFFKVSIKVLPYSHVLVEVPIKITHSIHSFLYTCFPFLHCICAIRHVTLLLFVFDYIFSLP